MDIFVALEKGWNYKGELYDFIGYSNSGLLARQVCSFLYIYYLS